MDSRQPERVGHSKGSLLRTASDMPLPLQNRQSQSALAYEIKICAKNLSGNTLKLVPWSPISTSRGLLASIGHGALLSTDIALWSGTWGLQAQSPAQITDLAKSVMVQASGELTHFYLPIKLCRWTLSNTHCTVHQTVLSSIYNQVDQVDVCSSSCSAALNRAPFCC